MVVSNDGKLVVASVGSNTSSFSSTSSSSPTPSGRGNTGREVVAKALPTFDFTFTFDFDLVLTFLPVLEILEAGDVLLEVLVIVGGDDVIVVTVAGVAGVTFLLTFDFPALVLSAACFLPPTLVESGGLTSSEIGAEVGG